LDAETMAVLEDWRPRQEFERRSWGKGYHSLDLVFCREDGSPYDADSITDKFQRWVKSAGLRRVRFHDVRHTHATLLLESGADISVVSKRLGHANVGFTAKVYAHVTDNLSQATADRFSAYLASAGRG
jgi:integrase